MEYVRPRAFDPASSLAVARCSIALVSGGATLPRHTGSVVGPPAELPTWTDGAEVSEWSTSASLPPNALYDEKELAAQAQRAVSTLEPGRARLVEAWLGLGNQRGNDLSQAEIGAREGIFTARVHQALENAFRRLRLPARARNLFDFFFPCLPIYFVAPRSMNLEWADLDRLYERIDKFGLHHRWLIC